MTSKPNCAFCGETYLVHDRTWQQWQCAACTNWNDHTEATVDDWEDDEPDASCTNPGGHEWAYTGTEYGGDDSSYHGEGRCYCEHCGADGDA